MPRDDLDLKIPAKCELTTLGPDRPRGETLGFHVYETQGVPIHAYNPEDHPEGSLDHSKLTPIDKDSLKDGGEVLVPSLVGGYHLMKAGVDNDGVFAKSGNMVAYLTFDTDRSCWVCIGMANLRALKKLEITR